MITSGLYKDREERLHWYKWWYLQKLVAGFPIIQRKKLLFTEGVDAASGKLNLLTGGKKKPPGKKST